MLTWLAFWFAFRSPREKMWQHCAILGIVVGIATIFSDFYLQIPKEEMLHPESRRAFDAMYANPGLLGTVILLDFILGLMGVLGICWFGWICRWCFIWRKEKEHPSMTAIARPFWHLGNFSWKIALIIGCVFLMLVIGIGFYAEAPELMKNTLILQRSFTETTPVPHYQTVPNPTPYADIDSPSPIETPSVRRALPVNPTQTPHRKHHPSPRD